MHQIALLEGPVMRTFRIEIKSDPLAGPYAISVSLKHQKEARQVSGAKTVDVNIAPLPRLIGPFLADRSLLPESESGKQKSFRLALMCGIHAFYTGANGFLTKIPECVADYAATSRQAGRSISQPGQCVFNTDSNNEDFIKELEMWNPRSLVPVAIAVFSLLTVPVDLQAGKLFSPGSLRESGNPVSFFVINNTSKIAKFKVRRGDGMYLGETGRVAPGGVDGFDIGNPAVCKIKAFIWNKPQQRWVAKTNWIPFQNSGNDLFIEFHRTANGSAYGLSGR